MKKNTSTDRDSVIEALEVERLATRCLIASLKSHLSDSDFERALSVAFSVSEQVAPESQSSEVKKAVRRLAFGLPVSR